MEENSTTYSTYQYLASLSKDHRERLITDVMMDPQVRDYFDNFVTNITGSLGSRPFHTVAQLNVKDLESLLWRVFSEGVLFNNLKYIQTLESTYLNHNIND